MEDLKSLVVQAQTGDLNAYTQLVERFQDMAFGYAHSLLGDFHLAQDASQEAFTVAYTQIANLKEPAAFSSWFRKIVMSCCERIRRKRPQSSTPLASATNQASNQPSPAQAVEEQESHKQVYAALQGLPKLEQQVITLFYIGEYARQDIASFLGIPLPAVIYRLRLGRKKLKERILAMTQQDLRQSAPSQDSTFVNEVKLQIVKLTDDPDTNKKKLWIQNAKDNEWITIELDDSECESIQEGLGGKEFTPPFIHQILGELLENIDAKITRIRVVAEQSEGGNVEFTFSVNKEPLRLNAFVRDSEIADLLALALKFKAPFYVPPEIWHMWQKTQGADDQFMAQATEQVKEVVQATREEAVRLGHNYIGTEHILLGMIKAQSTPQALAGFELDLDAVKKSVDDLVGAPGRDKSQSEPNESTAFLLTPRTLQVFACANDEIKEMGSELGGVEHLLLGILKESECLAAQVLANYQVDYSKLKSTLAL